jgi:hypothetical protein
MGYRSEVAYVIRFKDREMRELFVSLQRAKADKHINEALDELVEVEDAMLGFHADYVKWYDGYEDVKAHQQLLTDAIEVFNKDEDQAGYRFIRLGEEDDDNTVEEEGASDDLYEYVGWTKHLSVSFERNTYEQNQTEGETA